MPKSFPRHEIRAKINAVALNPCQNQCRGMESVPKSMPWHGIHAKIHAVAWSLRQNSRRGMEPMPKSMPRYGIYAKIHSMECIPKSISCLAKINTMRCHTNATPFPTKNRCHAMPQNPRHARGIPGLRFTYNSFRIHLFTTRLPRILSISI